MPENTITSLPDPSGFSADAFTDVLRNGARKLIEQAIHAELATLLVAFSQEKLADGRAPSVPWTLTRLDSTGMHPAARFRASR